MARLHVEEAIVSDAVRFDGPNGSLIGIGQSDIGVWNYGAAGVLDRADDRALRGLRMALHRGQSESYEQKKDHKGPRIMSPRRWMGMLKHRSLFS